MISLISTLTHSKNLAIFTLSPELPDFSPDTFQGTGKSGEKSTFNINLS